MLAEDVLRKLDVMSRRLLSSPLIGEKGFEGLPKVNDEIELLKSKLYQPLKIAVIGEVKAGKSTLINAFANGEVAPTNITEATACITLISYGEEEKAVFVDSNGDRKEDSIENILSILKKNENNQEFFKQCSHVDIYKPLLGLRKVQLLDTPGLATITTANEEKTKEYFQNVDVVLWVFNGHYLGQSDVNEELRKVAKMGKPVIGVINRIDEIDADPEALINYVDDNLGIYLKNIFAISAYNAFKGLMGDKQRLVRESGFEDLYNYLLEKIERNSDKVLLESISSSADVLGKKIELLHQQTLEQIEMKLSSYDEIDAQMRRSGNRLKERISGYAEDWIHKQYLQSVVENYSNKINNQGMFSSIDPDQLRQQIISSINTETNEEFDVFMDNLQQRISQEWKNSLELVDETIAELYDTALQKQNSVRMSFYESTSNGGSISENISDTMLTAGAVGTGLAFYTAVLGPSAAYVSIGAALGSIMPPVLLAGACVGGLQALMKNKQAKSRNTILLNNIVHEARMNMDNQFIPKLERNIDDLCTLTCSKARDEFIKKNFDGYSYESLQNLTGKLKIYVACNFSGTNLLE